jgi:hypothetical protein
MHLEDISRPAIKLALYNLESIQNNGAQVELRSAGVGRQLGEFLDNQGRGWLLRA